jgi:hypothetical protein
VVTVSRRTIYVAFLLCLLSSHAQAADGPKASLWALEPLDKSDLPSGVSAANPIDAFVAAQWQAKKLKPVGRADKEALLRRVYFDLIGLPPTPAEQAEFLADSSADAYEKVVDRLLANPQHGVRYGRHWLDLLRYADADERMVAAPGIHLWRDWVISALNDDVPYDQFVRAQLTGYRSTTRTQMSATGVRSRKDPRPDDLFALGFLARGALGRDSQASDELAIAAVETVSTAFMGLTVGCAKCHDHFYDPISQADFYSMKALFDPLVAKKVTLATPQDLVAAGKAQEAAEKERLAYEQSVEELVGEYRRKLYDERVAALPEEIQRVIRKPEPDRTAAEQKIADDYFPVLRIDTSKILEVLPDDKKSKYRELLKSAPPQGRGRRGAGTSPAVFWTVEVDRKRESEPSYILTSGDPARPERNREVKPGWPFAPANVEFRDGRIEAFSDWLTAPDNALFARVAVNRIWQWHFGTALHRTPSDFGNLSEAPAQRPLLDWLAAKFIETGFSMKAMHRLIVTSDAYKTASDVEPSLVAHNLSIDPENSYLWHFPLRRLEAEPIWDSILACAGDLDLSVGGPSYDLGGRSQSTGPKRRAAYLIRGYSSSRDVVPAFLQTFDVDDGRVPCPMRTRTVTAPQALFLMNSPEIDGASVRFADRVAKESGGDFGRGVELAYRIALGRAPSSRERDLVAASLTDDQSGLKKLAWLLFNLDEFLYVR